jgi:hypothetical protein
MHHSAGTCANRELAIAGSRNSSAVRQPSDRRPRLNSTVVARLDRAIQYAAASRMNTTASGILGSPVKPYRIHTSDSIFSVRTTKNVSHQSHLTRLRQHLMAQGGSPANLLKKSLISRCVNLIGSSRAMTAGGFGACVRNCGSRIRLFDITCCHTPHQTHLRDLAAGNARALP